MELKHKECFIPNTIHYWGLQGVSKYAREAAEFVNLFLKSRGINRFPALVEALEWTNRRPEVKARGIHVKIPQSLLDWMKRETKLGNPALEKEVERTGDPHLKHTLDWSKAINDAIGKMVRACRLSRWFAKASNASAAGRHLVVSATPHEALTRMGGARPGQIHGGDLRPGDRHEEGIAASRREISAQSRADDWRPPGDHQAAVANHALFFPINPGVEEASRRRFHEEGIDRFLAGMFAGEYQPEILAEFDRYLPAHPPWPVEEG